jgi:hypothetical protein
LKIADIAVDGSFGDFELLGQHAGGLEPAAAQDSYDTE